MRGSSRAKVIDEMVERHEGKRKAIVHKTPKKAMMEHKQVNRREMIAPPAMMRGIKTSIKGDNPTKSMMMSLAV